MAAFTDTIETAAVAATAAAITSGFILLLFVFIVMFLPFSAFIFSLTEPAMRTGSHSAVLSGAKLCDQLSFFFIFIAPFCQIFSKLFLVRESLVLQAFFCNAHFSAYGGKPFSVIVKSYKDLFVLL